MSNSKDDAGEDVKDKKDEVLSPLLVLEILKDKPNLKFKVIKKYLLNRLKIQDRVIRKHDKVVIARHTTKEKAQAQIRLLQSIEHPYKKNPKKKNKK